MLCLRTFKHKYLKDFDNWYKWQEFINSNIQYSIADSTVFDFRGKVEDWELPSHHPYWHNVVLGRKIKDLTRIELSYNQCINNPELTKVLFNSSTDIQKIKEKIDRLKLETQDNIEE